MMNTPFRSSETPAQQITCLAVPHQGYKFILPGFQQHFMMFAGITINAIGRQNIGPISLLCVEEVV